MVDSRIIATGMVPFVRRSESSADVLAARAVRRLFDDSGLDRRIVQETYVGTSKGGSLIGQRALRFAGLATGSPVFNVENACASSAVAFHLAHRAIADERIEAALVIGVDRLSDLGKGALPVQETEWDGRAGVTNPVVYAMRATRYMHDYGATREDLAAVSVKSRRFADLNPFAQMTGQTTVDEVLASTPIADPLTLFQCSAKSDGATAVLLVSDGLAKRLGRSGPRVRASEVRAGSFSSAARDITHPDITSRAADAAYAASGLSPADLDVVELHDAFSIAELLYTEELGLAEHGGAIELLARGGTSDLVAAAGAVVNPSGGLLSRGHPIGATGLAQLIEITSQLAGTAGSRQRENARAGLAHVTGGGASGFDNGACAVTVLTKD
ncbi:MAG TPA: thiolase family protein [Pseudolysinimonas sp.]|jgi:benzoylsuccinyl-CoA thiolase BbsB subunit